MKDSYSQPLVSTPDFDFTSPKQKNKTYQKGYTLLFAYGFMLFFLGFVFGPIQSLLTDFKTILLSPSHLLTDYVALTSLGSAFLSSSVLTLFMICVVYFAKIPLSGPLMAAILMVSGFSFFGKNVFNSIPLLFGTYLFAKVKQVPFSQYAIIGLFGSALSPVVSLFAFSGKFPVALGIPLGYLIGTIIGFILPPLATHFQTFTQGFNLYNVGFTSGIIGMLLNGILKMLGWEFPTNNILSTHADKELTIFLLFYAFILCILGLVLCHHEKRLSIMQLWKTSGKVMSDYLLSFGMGTTLLNMGTMAFLMLGYIKLTGGILNGPVIGTILSVIGFAAYGSHVYNSFPLLLGVYLAGLLNIYDITATSSLMAAFFSTTLGPIAGFYGIRYGVLAGMFHAALVINIGVVHGGLNLYNNGFSGGFIAAIMVPLLDSLHLGKEARKLGRRTFNRNTNH